MLLLFVFLLEKPQGKQEQRKTASETCECDLNLVFRRAGKVSQVDICMKEPGVGFTGGSHQGFEQLSESGRPLPLLLGVDGNWGGGGYSANPMLHKGMCWDPQPAGFPACTGCSPCWGEGSGMEVVRSCVQDRHARAWMPDDGEVTFHALEPLQKHRRDNRREPVMTFPGRRGAWPACLLPLEEVFHDCH